jgi:formamidopyrimidine-DNA glycosylase
MPELPEVENVARTLARRVTGLTIDRAAFTRRDIIRAGADSIDVGLARRTIARVERRAKRILVSLDPAGVLVVHLGMTGRLTVVDHREPVEPHTHARITLADSDLELRFRDPRRFGGLWFFDGHTPLAGVRLGPIGPEPLDITQAEFRRILNRRRQLKPLLMDQTVIAGLGNIYCDESLHAARLHPKRPGDSLSREEGARLWRTVRRILRRAIRFNGSTFMDYRDADGAEGRFQQMLRVYQREGEACPSCGETIIRFALGGRSTFACETCQPESGKCLSKRTSRQLDGRRK